MKNPKELEKPESAGIQDMPYADEDYMRTYLNGDESVIGSRKWLLHWAGRRGYLLQSMPDVARADREIVLAAISSGYEESFRYAHESLRADRDFMCEVLPLYPYELLEHAAENLRVDRDFVLAAVSRSGTSLRFASRPLRKDREVVLAAVTQDKRALKYASAALRKDPDVLRAAERAARS